jgi:hypothetical protein
LSHLVSPAKLHTRNYKKGGEVAYDRAKDVGRRIQYLAQADVANIKDMIVPRAKEIASTKKGDPQGVATSAYKQATEEYTALNGAPPALSGS